MQKKNNSLDVNPSEIKSLAFKGGKALLARHIAGFAVNFTGGIVLARLLGPEILGLYFISYTVLIILRQLNDFGISIHFIRVPSDPTKAELKSAFSIQQAIGLASGILTVALIAPEAAKWYGHKELSLLIASAAIGAYFNTFQSIPLAKLERAMDYRRVGFIELAEIIIFNAASVAGAFAGMGVAGLALGNILRGAVPALMAALMAGVFPSVGASFKDATSLVRSASPITGANLVVWVILAAPSVVVGSLAGAKALGIAQLSYTLLGNTMFIATIFQRIGLTSLSKFQDDRESFNKAVSRILHLLFIVYIPLTMCIASLSPWWVPLIYGTEWAGMETIIFVAAVPYTMAALFSIIVSALYSVGLSSLVLKQNLLHAFIYWPVMVALAPYHGALSVPVAHLFAMSACYMFVQGYARLCGRIDYIPFVAGFFAGIGVMAVSWYAAMSGYLIVSLLIWPAFIFLFLSLSASAKDTFLSLLALIRGGIR